MTREKLYVSSHAWRRMSQRGHLTLTDVLVVVEYGRRIHRAHADFYCLLGRCLNSLPKEQETLFTRLVGTVVCIEGNRISTVFKNKNAISKLRKKRRRYHGEKRGANELQFSGTLNAIPNSLVANKSFNRTRHLSHMPNLSQTKFRIT